MSKVLVVRVGQQPVVENVGTDLKAMQHVVGGYIQIVPLEDGCSLVCNEEGLLLELPLNRCFPARAPELPPGFDFVFRAPDLADPGEMGEHRIHGDFFICRFDESEDEELASLSDSDFDTWTKRLAL